MVDEIVAVLCWFLSVLCSYWTLGFCIILPVAYKWATYTFDFFEKKNVHYDKPIPLLGNLANFMLQREPIFDMVKRVYMKHHNRKFVGFFQLRYPTLVIIDPEVIKQVTVKDFECFRNHRPLANTEADPLFLHSLFNLQDKKWKDMRSTMSPAFTGSKMRLMYGLVNECGRSATEYLKKLTLDGAAIEIDCKDLFTRHITDVTATCAFGLHVNSLEEKDNEFYKLLKVEFSILIALKFIVLFAFPKLAKFLGVRVFAKEYTKYFYNLVLEAMEERKKHGIVRPDMVQLLMEARDGALHATDLGLMDSHDGFAVVPESEAGQGKVTRKWTEEELVAQSFVFIMAGFITSSILQCFCAQELMENPPVQEKLIEEIDEVRRKLGNEPLTYEVLQSMKYLDMFISETLRKWPPNNTTDRICTKECILGDINDENVQILPGEHITIPISGLHRDPEYFPDPDKFDPERFSDENKHCIKPFTYIPFGAGPRNCIGSRFAIMQAKAIIFHLLTEFTIEASPKSQIPMILSKRAQMEPKNGFWANFKPRVIFVGFFQLRYPTLVIIDPEVIKQVTVKDFECFRNHRPLANTEADPLFLHSLFNLQDKKWKDMRSTMSPAFTGSKMRLMYGLVNECGRSATEYLKKLTLDGAAIEIDCKDLFTRHITDVTATCAFGLHVNSLEEKDNKFYKLLKVEFSILIALKFIVLFAFPKLAKFLGVRVFAKEYTKYFYNLVLEAMEERKKHGIVRPDMVQLLMEARDGALHATDLGLMDSHDGFAVVPESEAGQGKVTRKWTEDELVAQSFVFIMAGFITSSILQCFCAQELMENPPVQEKLIEEIDEVRRKLGNEPLTYEVLQSMKYLDMFISETLRKWPPNNTTDRICTKECILGDINDENVQILPGEHITIPISGLHRDPEYFPDPDKFDPERFSDENKHCIKPFTYIPFGAGPRNCIGKKCLLSNMFYNLACEPVHLLLLKGSRFAIMQAKAIIFHLLTEFTIEASPKSQIPMILSKRAQMEPKNGFWLNFKPRIMRG